MNKFCKFLVVVISASSMQLVCMQDEQSQCSRWDTLMARWRFSDTVSARNKKMRETVYSDHYSDDSLPYLQALICANKSLISRRQPAASVATISTESGENEMNKTPYWALDWAVRFGRMTAVKAFTREFDLQPMVERGLNYRLMAFAMPSVEMSKLLLKSGIDVVAVQKFHDDNYRCLNHYPDYYVAPGYPYLKEAYDKAIESHKADSEKSK